MNYNWDGDHIIHDCILPGKRYVIGDPKTPIETDIRAFVSPADDAVIKEIVDDLVRNGMPVSKNPGDFDKRAMVVWQYVAKAIEYVPDIKRQRKGDFWLFPSEVNIIGKGDCEDGSFLLAGLLLGCGISPFNVRVVLGELVDAKGKSRGGHCWPIYKNEKGRWCILETTFEKAPRSMPAADRYAECPDVRYVPHFCFNNYHLWEIYHGDTRRGDLKGYLEGRKKLAKMDRQRFPSGGYISWITGENSPGHFEITGDALRSFGFSEDAVSIAADAAMDPDFYDWTTCGAHAQTEYDDEGRPSQEESEAVDKYIDWVRKHVGNMLLQSKKDAEHGLFFLGYVLHAVQDLASHKGITNPQHSYESTYDPGEDADCDHSEKNRELAAQYTRDFLGEFEQKYRALFEKLKTYDAPFSPFDIRLSKDEKCGLLGKTGDCWDLSFTEYLEYKALADKYAKIKDSVSFKLWETDDVFRRALGLL
jgi:hypothetical protein